MFDAKIHSQAFKRFLEAKDSDPKHFKAPDEENRIYPNSYAPVLIKNSKGDKIITPMKYQLLPSFSMENKYTTLNPKTGRKKQVSTYNARLDSLEKRQAWQNTFMKQHALIAISQFYEWVGANKKPELVSFAPSKAHDLIVPCLWDHWVSQDGKEEISSFAIITTNAPSEILNAGHDRCPIIIEEKDYDTWLSPSNHNKDKIYEILNNSSQYPSEVFECHSIMTE